MLSFACPNPKRNASPRSNPPAPMAKIYLTAPPRWWGYPWSGFELACASWICLFCLKKKNSKGLFSFPPDLEGIRDEEDAPPGLTRLGDFNPKPNFSPPFPSSFPSTDTLP